MNPMIACANTFTGFTVDTIISYRDSRPCLDCFGTISIILPEGVPELVSPAGGSTVPVSVFVNTTFPQPGTGQFHYRANGGAFTAVAMSEKINATKGVGEMADVFIQLLDLVGWVGVDLDRAVKEKRKYNQSRETRHGNKAF